ALAADGTINTNAAGNVTGAYTMPCLVPGTYRFIVDAAQQGSFVPGCDPVLCLTIDAAVPTLAVDAVQVEVEGQDAHLSWRVRDADSYRGFQVERSADGSIFQPVGDEIPNGGRAYPAVFTWLDRSLTPGAVVAYRIAAHRPDGGFDRFGPV